MKHAETALLSGARARWPAHARPAWPRTEAVSGTPGLHRRLLSAREPAQRAQRAGGGARGAARDRTHRTEARRSTARVARRNVQLGPAHRAQGRRLMTVIPLSKVWVEANFKEVQLRKMRVGQKAEVTADLYGGPRSSTTRTVVGLGAGTGSAFALLPAQNATGNWIKVVQRVPVRAGPRREAGRRSSTSRGACRWKSTWTWPRGRGRR